MERSDSSTKGKRKVEEEEQLARCSTKQMPDQAQLRLRFKSTFPLPLFTEQEVKGEQGAPIQVELFDATTGHIVKSGLESSAKLDVVLLDGDFDNDDDDDWTQEEFERHVLKERKGKAPLLKGDLQVKLKKGEGTLGFFSVTDNSHWIPSGKFRIGLKVATGHCEGIRVREAKTEAFAVKDRRGKSYQKHYPPALDDEVWRLDKIHKDGKLCKSLKDDGICTVRHFLRHLARDPENLRDILGRSMQNKKWKALVGHAKTTRGLDEKLHVYHLNDSRISSIVFNDVYELKGLIKDAKYHPADSFSCDEKVSMDDLVKKAYDDWEHIMEYGGNANQILKQNATEGQMAPDDTAPYYSPIPIRVEGPTLKAGLPPIGTGCNENPTAGFAMHGQANCFQFGCTSSPSQNRPTSTSHQTHILTNDRMGKLGPANYFTQANSFYHGSPSNLHSSFTSHAKYGTFDGATDHLLSFNSDGTSPPLFYHGPPSNLPNNLFDATQVNCFEFGGTSSPLRNQPTSTSHQAQISRNDIVGELALVSPHLSRSGSDNEFLPDLHKEFDPNDLLWYDEFWFDHESPLNPHNNLFDTTQANCFEFGGTSSPLQNQPTDTSHQTQIVRNDSMGEKALGSPPLSMSWSKAFLSSPINDYASNAAGSGKLGFDHRSPINLDHNFASSAVPRPPVHRDQEVTVKKVVVKLDLHNDNDKQRAMEAVCSLSGIDSVSMNMESKKLTVVGVVDPVDIVSKLRENWHTEILLVGPANEQKEKLEPRHSVMRRQSEPRKEEWKGEDKKKDPNEQQFAELVKSYKAYNPYVAPHYYAHSLEENPNACVIC